VDCRSTPIPYAHTRKFSPFITDYLGHKADLAPFHAHPVSLAGVKAAMEARDAFPTDRAALVEVLRRQYGNKAHPAQLASLEALEKGNSYTITTAHQPNIFTGYLYLVYKILHVIRIAEDLTRNFPDSAFVPVYYIGSEDNDLEELGQLQIAGNKLVWETKQTGAVGRMKVDRPLLALLDRNWWRNSGLLMWKALTSPPRRPP
jgi:bacillithiol synthase